MRMFSATVMWGQSDSSWWISAMLWRVASGGGGGRGGRPPLPVRSGAGREPPRQHVHQGTLASPVLPDQRMHLPCLELEGDPIERNRGAEALLNAVDVEKGHY